MTTPADLQLRALEKLQPTTSKEKSAQSDGNYFCTINLGTSIFRVILYFTESSALGPVLQKRLRDSDYQCSLLHTEERVVEECLHSRHPALVVVDPNHKSVGGVSCLEHLSRSIHSCCEDTVKFLPIVKSYSSLLTTELPAGVTRALSEEDCHSDQFLLALKLWERNEARLQRKLQLSQVFFEAVEQSGDAVQISGPDSCIVYVNRVFADISGYSRDEVVGKPAMDILRNFDLRSDNGPKLAVSQSQGWDGVCLGRRKSGSSLKQHIKLIPVKSGNGHTSYHITIQRLLSSHDMDHPRITSPRMIGDRPLLGSRQPSLGSIPNLGSRLEMPITKVVQVLSTARDDISAPVNVREAVEQAMEILCSAELFAPLSAGRGAPHKGIVAGLLQSGSGRRFSIGEQDTARVLHHHSHIPRNPPITPPPPEVQDAIQNLEAWEFDIINLEKLSSNEPLYYVGMRIFKTFEVCDILGVEETVVASWLKLMEIRYHRRNAYHNSTHAADVLQATAYFIKVLQDCLVSQGEVLERMEIAALLITAVIHDLDHPGRTNPHLCNTNHALATLYNDSAVLENHHVALSFKLSQESKGVNIYQNMDSSTYRSLRSSIIDLVLATDMAKHFEHLTKFNMYTEVDGEAGSTTSLTSTKPDRENRMAMKRILVKCADISNPCRPSSLCQEWAKRISEEYFAQTDEEKQRNLPVVFPDFDRKTCNLPITQVKFIDFFISGLFDAWHNFCPIPLVMDYLKENYEFWNSKAPSNATED